MTNGLDALAFVDVHPERAVSIVGADGLNVLQRSMVIELFSPVTRSSASTSG